MSTYDIKNNFVSMMDMSSTIKINIAYTQCRHPYVHLIKLPDILKITHDRGYVIISLQKFPYLWLAPESIADFVYTTKSDV